MWSWLRYIIMRKACRPFSPSVQKGESLVAFNSYVLALYLSFWEKKYIILKSHTIVFRLAFDSPAIMVT